MLTVLLAAWAGVALNAFVPRLCPEGHRCTSHVCTCDSQSERVTHHHGGITCYSCATRGHGANANPTRHHSGAASFQFEGGFSCHLNPVIVAPAHIKGQAMKRIDVSLDCERPTTWKPAIGVPGNAKQQRQPHVLDVPRPYVLLSSNRIQGPLGTVQVDWAAEVALKINASWTIPAQLLQPGDEVRAKLYDYNTHYHSIDRWRRYNPEFLGYLQLHGGVEAVFRVPGQHATPVETLPPARLTLSQARFTSKALIQQTVDMLELDHGAPGQGAAPGPLPFCTTAEDTSVEGNGAVWIKMSAESECNRETHICPTLGWSFDKTSLANTETCCSVFCPTTQPTPIMGLVWSPATCRWPTVTHAVIGAKINGQLFNMMLIGDSTTRYLYGHFMTLLDDATAVSYYSHHVNSRSIKHPNIQADFLHRVGRDLAVEGLLLELMSESAKRYHAVYFTLSTSWWEESYRPTKVKGRMGKGPLPDHVHPDLEAKVERDIRTVAEHVAKIVTAQLLTPAGHQTTFIFGTPMSNFKAYRPMSRYVTSIGLKVMHELAARLPAGRVRVLNRFPSTETTPESTSDGTHWGQGHGNTPVDQHLADTRQWKHGTKAARECSVEHTAGLRTPVRTSVQQCLRAGGGFNWCYGMKMTYRNPVPEMHAHMLLYMMLDSAVENAAPLPKMPAMSTLYPMCGPGGPEGLMCTRFKQQK